MDQNSDRKWQDLCQAAATEQDPKKLMLLVAEIIKTLDRNRRAGPPALTREDCDGSSFSNLYAVGRPKDQTCESGLSPQLRPRGFLIRRV